MAKFYDSISDTLRAFIEAQHLFFVASAPLSGEGHVNVSPKGMDSLRVLSPNRVAYIDLIGSGSETSAHLHENGRITFMWCAFTGKPDPHEAGVGQWPARWYKKLYKHVRPVPWIQEHWR